MSPPDGHVLVAGDIWINQSQCHDLQDARPKCVLHPSAAGLALGLADAGMTVTLLGFVGDDELADAVERPLQAAGVGQLIVTDEPSSSGAPKSAKLNKPGAHISGVHPRIVALWVISPAAVLEACTMSKAKLFLWYYT